MGSNSYAALRGIEARERYGAPPCDQDDALHWTLHRLGIWTDVRADLPVNGLAYCPPVPQLRGAIILSAPLVHPRWTLAHEIAHVMLGDMGRAHLQLSDADDYWQRIPAERAANAFAATFLLSMEELCRKFQEDWTRSQIAAYHGVPADVVSWRLELARALGEHCPNRATKFEVMLLRLA